MFTKTKSFALAALRHRLGRRSTASAIADGAPVVPRSHPSVRCACHSTIPARHRSRRRASPATSPDFAPIYDTSVLQGVTTRPVSNVRISGENVDIEYDNEAAARAPHALPDFSLAHMTSPYALLT